MLCDCLLYLFNCPGSINRCIRQAKDGWHAGVPLRVASLPRLPLQQLPAALSSVPLASVTLRDSLVMLHSWNTSEAVSALASSASTLTALHGLPLYAAQQNRPQPGLAAFTQLRALTLYQTEAAPKALRAMHLPASLEELTLESQIAVTWAADWMQYRLPSIVAFDELTRLRRLTLASFQQFSLRTGDDEEGLSQQLQLPHSLEVLYAGSEFALLCVDPPAQGCGWSSASLWLPRRVMYHLWRRGVAGLAARGRGRSDPALLGRPAGADRRCAGMPAALRPRHSHAGGPCRHYLSRAGVHAAIQPR